MMESSSETGECESGSFGGKKRGCGSGSFGGKKRGWVRVIIQLGWGF